MPKEFPLKVWLERSALICFGLILALLLLESILQLMALGYGKRSEDLPDASKDVVLALGDSHTYGIFYDQHAAYPGQLQTFLNQRQKGRYQVINLGLPGTSSREVAFWLEDWYRRYRPRYAIVCAGINNTWNWSHADAELVAGQGGGKKVSSGGYRWRTRRLFRLLRQALRDKLLLPSGNDRPNIRREVLEDGNKGVEHYDLETGELLMRHEGNLHSGKRNLEQALELLRQDLKYMIALSEDWGVELLLLTYAAQPPPGYPYRFKSHFAYSDVIAETAKEYDVRLIDVRPKFRYWLSEKADRTVLFHSQRDGHPNPRGYTEIATLLAEEILPPKK